MAVEFEIFKLIFSTSKILYLAFAEIFNLFELIFFSISSPNVKLETFCAFFFVEVSVFVSVLFKDKLNCFKLLFRLFSFFS